jgi:hypothetical protein
MLLSRIAMRLIVTVPGASAEEIAEREAAARAVLEQAVIDPRLAAIGLHDRERWDMLGFGVACPHPVLMEAAGIWDEAEAAALDDKHPGWGPAPGGSHLSLVEMDWTTSIPGLPTDPSQAIVQAAEGLRKRFAHLPALEILDQAMDKRGGSYPTFRDGFIGNPLREGAVLGELLREAFVSEEMATLDEDELHAAVVRAFGMRYRLWR